MWVCHPHVCTIVYSQQCKESVCTDSDHIPRVKSSLSTVPVSASPRVFLCPAAPLCPFMPGMLSPPVCESHQHCICLWAISPLSLHICSPHTFLHLSVHPGPSRIILQGEQAARCPMEMPWPWASQVSLHYALSPGLGGGQGDTVWLPGH